MPNKMENFLFCPKLQTVIIGQATQKERVKGGAAKPTVDDK